MKNRPMRMNGWGCVWLCLGLAALAGCGEAVPGPVDAGPDGGPGPIQVDLSSPDPDRLFQGAADAQVDGQPALAAKALKAALDRVELADQISLRGRPWQAALQAELLGDAAGADAAWAQAFAVDLSTSLIALRLLAPSGRQAVLLARARADLDARLAQLAAGGAPSIFTTPKGEARLLVLLPGDRALEAMKKGEEIKYAYIPELDVRGLTFDKEVRFTRCVIGKLTGAQARFAAFHLNKTFVLGDLSLGKGWEGEVNKSPSLPAARFAKLDLRESIIYGATSLEDVDVTGLSNLIFTQFLGPADLRSLAAHGVMDLRWATFAQPSRLSRLELGDVAFLGHTRFDADVDLSGMRARRGMVYVDSARFAAKATFDQAEFGRGVTFENAAFVGPALLTRMRVAERVSLTRVQTRAAFRLDESEMELLDVFGADFAGPVSLGDVTVRGTARFSMDSGQRRRVQADPAGLPQVYRVYSGDEDADPAFGQRAAYGVEGPDDLTTRFEGDVSLANLNVRGRLVLEGVTFGADKRPVTVQFFGARINETHMESATVYGRLDLSFLGGVEVALNGASVQGVLILDNSNVTGRLSLSDLTLGPTTTLSLWSASVAQLQIAREQIERKDGTHTLFYELCAEHLISDAGKDERLPGLKDKKLTQACFERAMDEYATLQDAFNKQSKATDHDWAFWYQKHYATVRDLREGPPMTKLWAATQWLVFEKGFGWGVRLGNILMTALVISVLFTFLYRWICHDTEVKFSGDHYLIKEMGFLALFTMSLQSLIGANIGWDVSGKDRRFKYVNTVITLIGIILITFFVGAYTRMVLA
jgi:hypothetical protein